MHLLLPQTDLSSLTQKEQEKIKELRKIINTYISFIPSNQKKQVKSAKDVIKFIHPLLKGKETEELWVILLNSTNHITKCEIISSGGLNWTIIDQRIILKKALENLSSSIIIVHNHPSGSPLPGKSDIESTQKLKKGCDLLNINLLDHIIVTENFFYSFAEEKSLPITSKLISQI